MFICEVTTVCLDGLNVCDRCCFLLGGGGGIGILDFVLAVVGIKLEFLRNFSEPKPGLGMKQPTPTETRLPLVRGSRLCAFSTFGNGCGWSPNAEAPASQRNTSQLPADPRLFPLKVDAR